jgi:hypothetical protein
MIAIKSAPLIKQLGIAVREWSTMNHIKYHEVLVAFDRSKYFKLIKPSKPFQHTEN